MWHASECLMWQDFSRYSCSLPHGLLYILSFSSAKINREKIILIELMPVLQSSYQSKSDMKITLQAHLEQNKLCNNTDQPLVNVAKHFRSIKRNFLIMKHHKENDRSLASHGCHFEVPHSEMLIIERLFRPLTFSWFWKQKWSKK